MTAPEEIGHVTEKWWETKKILDWKYETPFNIASPLMEKLGLPVATVSLRNAHNEDKIIWFVANSRWFGRHSEITDKTLEGLRVKVNDAFRDQILAHTQVKWEDWIEVEMSEHDVKTGDKEGRATINVKYELLKRARFPDGRDMVLDRDSLHPFPKAKAAGVERDRYASRDYFQDSDKQYAYIPATPENLEAVVNLMNKVAEVSERLQEVLSQKAIARTLGLLTGGQLLLDKPK